MRDVVSPRALTYNGTFHQWLVRGVSASRTLPTIWVHMCSVAQLSFHDSSRNSGQHSSRSELTVPHEFFITYSNFTSYIANLDESRSFKRRALLEPAKLPYLYKSGPIAHSH